MRPLPPYLATTRRADHTPNDRRVFVFGSNEQGYHGAGAARYAAQQLDAVMGVGQGATVRTYAIPTCSVPGVGLPLEKIKTYVDMFLSWATLLSNTQFYVSAIGCGFAGYTEAEIAPMFKDAPDNCDLPDGWRS